MIGPGQTVVNGIDRVGAWAEGAGISARTVARLVLRIYAFITAAFISVMVFAGYVIGAAAYFEGWSVGRAVAEASAIDDTVLQEVGTNSLSWILVVAIYGPALALFDTFVAGATRLGYATHSELFANALAFSLMAVVGIYTARTLRDLYYGGAGDGD